MKWFMLVCASWLVSSAGCSVAEFALSDIRGWDLGACVDGFPTCWRLFWDNADQIQGGGATITNLLGQ